MSRSPWASDDVEALRELATSFFTNEALPREEEFAAQGFPGKDMWQAAGKVGLLCVSIPEEYGGGGGSFAHEVAVIEAQIRVGAGAMAIIVHAGIVAHYINAYATEEQKRRWLPRMASGDLVGAIAMTEPGTGSDLQSIATKAVRDGDEYVISGAKTFITNGHTAGLIVIAAKTDASQGAHGVSLLVAEVGDGVGGVGGDGGGDGDGDRDTPGFQRGRVLNKVGQHSTDTAELFFDGLRVPAENLLGGVEGQGFVQLMVQLPQERLLVAAAGLAMLEAAVDHTVAYTKQREAFGKPLFKLQNTRFELAECATIARVARVFFDDCVRKHLDGGLDATTASMAKYWITDRQTEVVDRCVQLHGGYGYMLEYPIARLFVDGRVQRIYGGANEIMKELIARSL
ncbi:acyl-CoA dehydrogenase family protein [Catenulispora pinisilvae]|uniref:acyl-CoA dehydrogenase family protein n=1 Tax=Catenulispora pinisilvae TaxID=2705253 RepID=UPI001891D86A|nr:acyl-CoA dehydrogenase family protein [Catenulispora pinisilvae]